MVAERLFSKNQLLISVSKFFVERHEVQELAGILLKDIPPYGVGFVKREKKPDNAWDDVACDVMREW